MNIEKIYKDCCGCRSCEQSCPKNCIEMIENEEGFIYPKVDKSKCIDCGICLNKCPIYSYVNNKITPKAYALKNKNLNNLKNSASGGASDVIARKVIASGGVVYGVAYDNEFNAKHIRVDNELELLKIQSSKYVFADTNNTYSQVKLDLNKGIKVLYTGTSCQIDGLLKYLGKDYENLFTISLICHGVPSPKLFKGYIKYIEQVSGKKVAKYNFRYKKGKGDWGLTGYTEFTDGSSRCEDLGSTPYGIDFLNGVNYRESCYNCKYCNINRVGDWSIGDYWGIYKIHPKFANRKGVSIVLVMTQKGEEMLNSISSQIDLLESTIDGVILNQENLKRPTNRQSLRDTYYTQYLENEYFFKSRTPKKNLKYFLKKICPSWVKKAIKTILHKI